MLYRIKMHWLTFYADVRYMWQNQLDCWGYCSKRRYTRDITAEELQERYGIWDDTEWDARND